MISSEQWDVVTSLINQNQDTVIAWRRHLHQHPELSFVEFETAKFLAKKLKQMGYRVISEGTGVIGVLETGRPGPSIAFRADIDALPIQEATELPYKSIYPGIMHGCGHDVHAAILLGAAGIFSEIRESLCGCIKVIFQPGEESFGGAKPMIDSGALIDPPVEAIFGMHVMPSVSVGTVAIKEGYLTSAEDAVTIRIKGKAAHSSEPEKGVDAISIAAAVLQMMKSIQCEKINPLEVSTFSICKIRGGEAENILADTVEMQGTIRCVRKEDMQTFRQEISHICSQTAQAMGGSAEIIFEEGFSAVYNDGIMTAMVSEVIEDVLGGEQLWHLERPYLWSEDFSHYQEVVPGVMFLLGCGVEGEDRGTLHSTILNIHEDCIACGLKVYSGIALTLCGRHSLVIKTTCQEM